LKDQAFDRNKHWEGIYQNKALDEVGWHEPIPQVSLELIARSGISKEMAIIDIGGGDSLLTDHLLDMDYSDLTVLDISEKAIERARKRLGQRAAKVKWIVSDITEFTPTRKYDLWHDRAAFHFLTDERDIGLYKQALVKGTSKNGKMILGTFSEQGPTKCSGIAIKQYSKRTLASRFNDSFVMTESLIQDHITPFNTRQNYIFGTFNKKHNN
jgi:2-polyprenyl-3-methyl-5-hydroxy-6-metoxy-1,4-benzoquinol methylase